ncbi:MAG: hypothetical protein WCX28_00095 [Bacteriovoracaceae bacterium]|nr:hypothetical protein [Bacteroidota bacterium]
MAYSKGTLAGDFIDGVLSELSGAIAVGVVEIIDELSMDTFSVRDGFDPDVACAHMLEVVKAQQQTIKALRLNESIKDMCITMDTQVHLLTLSKSGKALFYVAAESAGANVSIMRSVIRKYAKGI